MDHLKQLVDQGFDQVNDLILTHLQSQVPLIQEIGRYILAAGGKRLRPLLTLASAASCGYQGKDHAKLACAIEFLHTATLLHDDVVDQSDMRRGQKTANNVWGNQPSVLVGDFLFSRAFDLLVDAGRLDVLKVIASTAEKIAEGEVKQLGAIKNLDTSLHDYLDIIECKTAKLFGAAAKAGAMMADSTQADAFYEYGLNLGMAFQIIDDCLDYGSEVQEMGKSAGDDFKEGKITLPLILAYSLSNQEQKTFWQQSMEQEKIENNDFLKARDIIQTLGVLESAKEMAHEFGHRAKQAIAQLPANDINQALIELVDFSLNRRY